MCSVAGRRFDHRCVASTQIRTILNRFTISLRINSVVCEQSLCDIAAQERACARWRVDLVVSEHIHVGPVSGARGPSVWGSGDCGDDFLVAHVRIRFGYYLRVDVFNVL